VAALRLKLLAAGVNYIVSASDTWLTRPFAKSCLLACPPYAWEARPNRSISMQHDAIPAIYEGGRQSQQTTDNVKVLLSCSANLSTPSDLSKPRNPVACGQTTHIPESLDANNAVPFALLAARINLHKRADAMIELAKPMKPLAFQLELAPQTTPQRSHVFTVRPLSFFRSKDRRPCERELYKGYFCRRVLRLRYL
jgi:hypothetical protein